ncbi:MAG: hypothetical protein QME21_09410 [Anaerolineales bacterium]|nr:hypothetical protein [Anaerolineales bacterium]
MDKLNSENPIIRNQWYVLLESDEVREKPVGVTRMGEKMVFWKSLPGWALPFPHLVLQLAA